MVRACPLHAPMGSDTLRSLVGKKRGLSGTSQPSAKLGFS